MNVTLLGTNFFISPKIEIKIIHDLVSVQTVGDRNTNYNEYEDLKTCVVLDLRKLPKFLMQISFEVKLQYGRQAKYTFNSSFDSDT